MSASVSLHSAPPPVWSFQNNHYYDYILAQIQQRPAMDHQVIHIQPANIGEWQHVGPALNRALLDNKILRYAFTAEGNVLLMVTAQDTLHAVYQAATPWYAKEDEGRPIVPPAYGPSAAAPAVPVSPIPARLVAFIKEMIARGTFAKQIIPIDVFELCKKPELFVGSIGPAEDMRKALEQLVNEGSIVAYAYGAQGGSFLIYAKEGDAFSEATQKMVASDWYSQKSPEAVKKVETLCSEAVVARVLEMDRSLTVDQLKSLAPIFEKFATNRSIQETVYGNQNPDMVILDSRALTELDPKHIKMLLYFLLLTEKVAAVRYERSTAFVYMKTEAIKWDADVMTREKLLRMDAAWQEHQKRFPIVPFGFTERQSQKLFDVFKNLEQLRILRASIGNRVTTVLGNEIYDHYDIVYDCLAQQGFFHSWLKAKIGNPRSMSYTIYVKLNKMDALGEVLGSVMIPWRNAAEIQKAEEFNRANRISIPESFILPKDIDSVKFREFICELNQRGKAGPYLFYTGDSASTNSLNAPWEAVFDLAQKLGFIHGYRIAEGYYPVQATIFVKDSDRVAAKP